LSLPKEPPSPDVLLERFFTGGKSDLGKITELLALDAPLVQGKYLHWDELLHRQPPHRFSHEEWWLALKMKRKSIARPLPLIDRDGRQCSWSIVDPLPELLHQIDLQAGGLIAMPEQITNPATRDQYYVSSLIEEAITSSQLEGATTTRKVAKEMLREGRQPRTDSERMIVNNYRMMERLNQMKSDKLTPDLVFEMHRIITYDTLQMDGAAGRFRTEYESVRVYDDKDNVVHVPPAAAELRSRMGAMCDFANAQDQEPFIHPVVRSMLLHYWLAYDHPFVDGNGRTARALFYWAMLRSGYWLFEFISISRIILKSPKRYGRAFLFSETDANDLTYFLLYHVRVIERALRELHAYIKRRSLEVKEAETQMRGLALFNHRQIALLNHALRNPGESYTIRGHEHSHKIVYQTARTDLLELVEHGLLEEHSRGRQKVFNAPSDLRRKLLKLKN
jgi:Fic family protein